MCRLYAHTTTHETPNNASDVRDKTNKTLKELSFSLGCRVVGVCHSLCYLYVCKPKQQTPYDTSETQRNQRHTHHTPTPQRHKRHKQNIDTLNKDKR